MEYKRKECWCCNAYRAYYTKTLCHFEKDGNGFCRVHKTIINDKHHTCEKWRFNGCRRQIRKNVSLKALNKALDNLVEIRQILVDEMNDNKINPID
jgi:hypothetical protein